MRIRLALAFALVAPILFSSTIMASDFADEAQSEVIQGRLERMIELGFKSSFRTGTESLQSLFSSRAICAIFDKDNLVCAKVSGIRLSNGYLKIVLVVEEDAAPTEVRELVFMPEHPAGERWKVESRHTTRPILGVPWLIR